MLSSTGMWNPYQSSSANTNNAANLSIPLDNCGNNIYGTGSNNSPLNSENSSGSSSPVSSSSEKHQTALSIASFMPNYEEDSKLNQLESKSDEHDNYMLNAHQHMPQQQHLVSNSNYHLSTSDNNDSVVNSSDSSSISATSTPTYRSPSSSSYLSTSVYSNQNSFVPFNQYQTQLQHSNYNYFNGVDFNSYYSGNSQLNSGLIGADVKQEVDYSDRSSSHGLYEKQPGVDAVKLPVTASPLSNMLNIVNPGQSAIHNPYSYYNGMSLSNSYYAPQYFNHNVHQHQMPVNNYAVPSREESAPVFNKIPKMEANINSQVQAPKPVGNSVSSSPVPALNYEFNGNNLTPNFSGNSGVTAAVAGFGNNNPKATVNNPNIKVKLQDMSLWKQFNQIGTEMIITKCGRRMFPSLRCSISGLDTSAKYMMVIDIIPVDDNRYKYHNCEWIVSGKAEAHFVGRGYLHPDSPLTGSQWMKQIISFHKLKLTNNPFDRSGHIILNSMHKYVPRLHIIEEGKSINTYVLNECVFTAVTAYQNELITKLKIEYNPFAKGFRDGQNRQGFRGGKRSSDDENDVKEERPFNQNAHNQMTHQNNGLQMEMIHAANHMKHKLVGQQYDSHPHMKISCVR